MTFTLTRESKKVILDQKQSNGRAKSESPPAAPRRSPNGFILPDPLPKGHRVIDNRGVQWRIGSSIGLVSNSTDFSHFMGNFWSPFLGLVFRHFYPI